MVPLPKGRSHADELTLGGHFEGPSKYRPSYIDVLLSHKPLQVQSKKREAPTVFGRNSRRTDAEERDWFKAASGARTDRGGGGVCA